MQTVFPHKRQEGLSDPYAMIVMALDAVLMALYAHLRRNARRLTRLCVALIPLIVLLVGSCKTAALPAAYGSNAGPDQFRTALFPDRVNFKGVHYYPAEGYIARARKYVTGDPDALMMLTGEEISYLFGKPAMSRHDADAEIWQYKTGGCVVDFFFYKEEGDVSAPRVAYVDVRGHADRLTEELPQPSFGKGSRCLEAIARDALSPAV